MVGIKKVIKLCLFPSRISENEEFIREPLTFYVSAILCTNNNEVWKSRIKGNLGSLQMRLL